MWLKRPCAFWQTLQGLSHFRIAYQYIWRSPGVKSFQMHCLIWFKWTPETCNLLFHTETRNVVNDSPFENRSNGPGSCAPRLSDRVRLALRMLPSELGLPLLRQRQQLPGSWRDSVQQLCLIMLLFALMWFVRLYLHYCSQWLYLQAIGVPVNKWVSSFWYDPAQTCTHACKHTCGRRVSGCIYKLMRTCTAAEII